MYNGKTKITKLNKTKARHLPDKTSDHTTVTVYSLELHVRQNNN